MQTISTGHTSPTNPPSSPRIYVASLSDYNASRLFGCWIDATDANVMREKIAEMLAMSPETGAEEYAIHDHDGFGGLEISEFEDLDTVAAAAQLIEEHGELAAKVIESLGGLRYIEAARTALTENRAGTNDTLQDWAAEYLEETGVLASVPEDLRQYFDYFAYAQDLELSGDISSIRFGERVHVFWNPK